VIDRCEIVTKTKWKSGAACTSSVCQRDVEGEGPEGERHEHSVRTKLLHYFSVKRWAVYITGTRAVAAMTRLEMQRKDWRSAATQDRIVEASLAEALAGCSERDRSMSLCLLANGRVMQQLLQRETRHTPASQSRGSGPEHFNAAAAFGHGGAPQQRRDHRVRCAEACWS
jgi:hypothetical protein